MKSRSFNVCVRYFVSNFKGALRNSTQNILPIHWKMWILYNIEILRALGFESSSAFLECPPEHTVTMVVFCYDLILINFTSVLQYHLSITGATLTNICKYHIMNPCEDMLRSTKQTKKHRCIVCTLLQLDRLRIWCTMYFVVVKFEWKLSMMTFNYTSCYVYDMPYLLWYILIQTWEFMRAQSDLQPV